MSESIIPLNKLVHWAGNVRKTGAGEGIDELASSIAAHGLLQQLVVRKAQKGRYAVIAGERRRQALVRLAEQGQLEADHPVPCRVITGEVDATEISLAENVVRVSMHPADQFEAFRNLIDAGAGVADVAARFGVSELTVTRRMRLGRVAPKILDSYRQGQMGLEQVQAFAISDDHARQEAVWVQITSVYGGRSPQLIRQMLTEGEIPATDKRVRLVTLEAYEAAGGAVRRDLFDERGEGYVLDVDLLDRLVADKLAEAAASVAAEGWKWTEVRSDFDWQEHSKFKQVEPEATPLSDEESDEYDRLEAEIEELGEGVDTYDELSPEARARLAEIEQRMAVLNDRLEVYPDNAHQIAGAIVTLRGDGTIRIERGLIRPEDQTASVDDGDAGGEATFTKPKGMAAALIEDLTQHRTAILQAALADNPHVALAAVTHALALKTFYPYGRDHSCVGIALDRPSLPATRETRAAEAMAATRERWGDYLPGDPGELWQWCLEQDDSRLVEVLAVSIAASVDVVQRRHDQAAAFKFRHGQSLARALEVDVADWFRPTAANYFGRIDKASILAAIAEARRQPNEIAWAKLKKADLAAMAERYTASTTWLPELLRVEPLVDGDNEMAAELTSSAA